MSLLVTEFMTSVGAQNLIMFHLHVEGFKTSAEQVAPGGRDIPSGTRLEGSVQSLREAAQHIYNTYLSEQVSHLCTDFFSCRIAQAR